MGLPEIILQWLDHGRAEAKRHGHAELLPIHLIAGMLRVDPKRAEVDFGVDLSIRVTLALGAIPYSPGNLKDSEDLTALLSTVAASANPQTALINCLVLALLSVESPEIAAASAAAPRENSVEKRRAAFEEEKILSALRSRLAGQDSALESVVGRLAMTRAQLDLKPHRPDGVFLFAGPSGVGKTTLALALADLVFGDEGACIRLDMSEYLDEASVTRLIGPPPGYIGSDDPSSWLTTKITARPESVVLFDELEKAHPRVWNVLLQILDAGRLTDSKGKQASFSHAIIVMTSNLGCENFRSKQSIGFLSSEATEDDAVAERTIDAIREAMPPELINRIDEVVVFSALSSEAIQVIAEKQIEALIVRLRDRGYEINVPSEVIKHIAESGYDPSYGARHLQRNIERQLLQSLTRYPPSKISAKLNGSKVFWEKVDS